MFKKSLIVALISAFIIQTVAPGAAFSQTVLGNTPAIMQTTLPFVPATIKGITIYPDNPLKFDFIVDTGDETLSQTQLKEQSTKMIKYFLASLTVPNKELWVNLNPKEHDRIIAEKFGQTEMGQDLLAQDYILKQLTASLMYPESELGAKFWDRVYAEAKTKFNVNDIPTDTLNKVWIVPQNATVYVNGNNIFVVNSTLKVMLEEEYFKPTQTLRNSDTQTLIKTIIIPAIEKEVNTGKHFANLRQIYNSMILALWYKTNLKQNLLNAVYADKNKINGVNSDDKNAKEKIYQKYLKTFENGIFNYIKEEYDPAKGEITPKKYISGGAIAPTALETKTKFAALLPTETAALPNQDHTYTIGTDLAMASQAPKTKAQKYIDSKKSDNPYWTSMRARVKSSIPYLKKFHPNIVNIIQKEYSIYGEWVTEDMTTKTSHTPYKALFYHTRVQNNAIKGPPKGGIRWLNGSELMRDEHFRKALAILNSFNPSEDEVYAFIKKWIDQEAKSLALGMTLKTAGLNLDLGGGKGTVFYGKVVKLADGSFTIEDYDESSWKNTSTETIAKIARRHSSDLAKAKKVGIDIDIPAPDVNTDGFILSVYADEYFRYLANNNQLKDKELQRRILLLNALYEGIQTQGQNIDLFFYHLKQLGMNAIYLEKLKKIIIENNGILPLSETPALKMAADYFLKGNAVPELGVYTGLPNGEDENGVFKPENFLGGALGRTEATGFGVVDVITAILGDISSKTAAVQGMGNVGSYTALGLRQKNAHVQVLNDYGITLYKKQGWSEQEILEIMTLTTGKNKISFWEAWKNGLISKEGVIATVTSIDPFEAKDLSPEAKTKFEQELAAIKKAVLCANVDILVPAVRENEIDEEIAVQILAKWIFEGANGAVSTNAKAKLPRTTTLVPDTLANAGGVFVSGLQTEQAKSGIHMTKSQVNEARKKMLTEAAKAVMQRRAADNIDSYQLAFDVQAQVNIIRAQFTQLLKTYKGSLYKITKAIGLNPAKPESIQKTQTYIENAGLSRELVTSWALSYREKTFWLAKILSEKAYVLKEKFDFEPTIILKIIAWFQTEFAINKRKTLDQLDALFYILKGYTIQETANLLEQTPSIIRKERKETLASIIQMAQEENMPLKFQNYLIELRDNKTTDTATQTTDLAMQTAETSRAPETNKTTGGIDLDPAMMTLTVNKGPDGMPLPTSQQPSELINVDGFIPILTSIRLTQNLNSLIGK
ncbi:MAG: Glu/Leu/Phe/Val dehydrogenase [Candidatus Omnitrophica bacterium]|nr:Glu/Leu/Phe/Val dehydrogenase [Candidatus Omnitrophota bacterium]